MNMNDYDRSNYNRKHQVIWHEDLLLYTSGCKSWPNNNFDYNELLKKVEDRKKLQNSDDIVLHDMLNRIKENIKSLDYNDAKQATIKIVEDEKIKNKKFIEDCITEISHKMQHIDKSKYFKADEYDSLMLFAEFNGSKRERYSREYDRILLQNHFDIYNIKHKLWLIRHLMLVSR